MATAFANTSASSNLYLYSSAVSPSPSNPFLAAWDASPSLLSVLQLHPVPIHHHHLVTRLSSQVPPSDSHSYPVISIYCTWVSSAVNTRKSSASPSPGCEWAVSATAEDFVYVIHDVNTLLSEVRGDYVGHIYLHAPPKFWIW
ncbi:unnamed protein product [Microthlaspi erraticum]|uniref:COG complex component COG2 C-terminal domain-containing protein n=1 Tax=Microthlaspi erraticum TaxID=1685480 RepID=A0A6D2HJ82_9BRAS|nr:unnamed protein product [Microthlaspi erraticum]